MSGQRQWAQIKPHEIQDEHKNRMFCCGGGQTQEEVAQKGSGASLCEEISNLAGHHPGQLALSNAALAVWLDQIIWRGPLPNIPVTAALQPWELSHYVSGIPQRLQHCDCLQLSNLVSNFIVLHASGLLVCF